MNQQIIIGSSINGNEHITVIHHYATNYNLNAYLHTEHWFNPNYNIFLKKETMNALAYNRVYIQIFFGDTKLY